MKSASINFSDGNTMTRTSLFPFLLVVILIAASSLHAQSDFEKEADAVFENISHEFILNADGSTTYNYEHHLRLLTGYAFSRQYGESFIVYNPKWQTLKVTASETKMADGKLVASPFNAYNEVLPGWAAGAPVYSGLREMVVTHTGLEKNSVVRFAYTITTKAGMLPGLMGKVMFGDRSPIKKLTVRVKLPPATMLMHETMNGARMQPTSMADGYEWVKENIPLVPVESSQPSMESFVPTLFFTTVNYDKLLKHVIGDEKSLYALSEKATRVAASITKDAKSDLEKVLAIRKHVEQNVGAVGGDLIYVGYQPMKAQETFDRNVGTQLDKSVLMAALSRAVKVDAHPALVAITSKYVKSNPKIAEKVRAENSTTSMAQVEPDVPALPFFSGALVACSNLDEKTGLHFFDPFSSQSNRYGARFTDRLIWIMTSGAGQKEYCLTGITTNSISTTSDWTLKKDGTFEGKTRVEASGAFTTPYQKDALFASTRRAFSKAGQGATVKEDESNHKAMESTCDVSLTSKYACAAHGDIVKFTLPVAPGGFADLHLGLINGERATPIDIPFAMTEEQKYHIHLPFAWAAIMPQSMPKGKDRDKSLLSVKNEVGEVSIMIEVGVDDVDVVKKLTLTKSRIEPNEYAKLRELAEAWLAPMHRDLYLKTN